MDYGDALRKARTSSSVTSQQLADWVGTSRPAISAYETGSKTPRLDTAQRLFRTLDKSLVPLDVKSAKSLRLSVDLTNRFTSAKTKPQASIAEGFFSSRATVLEEECAAQRITLTLSQCHSIANGYWPKGDTYDLWCAQQMNRKLNTLARQASAAEPIALETAIESSWVVAEDRGTPIQRGLGFYVKAVSIGADPFSTRWLMNAYLCAQGLPALWPTYKRIPDYHRALTQVVDTGETALMLDVLTDNLHRRFSE